MASSKFRISEWLGISLDLLFRLVWVSTVLVIGAWLWPEGILATPLAEIHLGTALWAIGSMVLVAVGLVALYVAVVEPYVAVCLDLKQEDRNSPSRRL